MRHALPENFRESKESMPVITILSGRPDTFESQFDSSDSGLMFLSKKIKTGEVVALIKHQTAHEANLEPDLRHRFEARMLEAASSLS